MVSLSQNKPQAASTLGSVSMVTEQERPGPSKEQPAPLDKQQGHDAAAGTQTIVGCALLPKKVLSVDYVFFALLSDHGEHRIRPQVTHVSWEKKQQQKCVRPLPCLAGQVARYLTQRMLQTAADNNIQIKQIDYTQPLEPQGPFNVIIHKLRPNAGTGLNTRMPSAAVCSMPHRCTAHTLLVSACKPALLHTTRGPGLQP